MEAPQVKVMETLFGLGEMVTLPTQAEVEVAVVEVGKPLSNHMICLV